MIIFLVFFFKSYHKVFMLLGYFFRLPEIHLPATYNTWKVLKFPGNFLQFLDFLQFPEDDDDDDGFLGSVRPAHRVEGRQGSHKRRLAIYTTSLSQPVSIVSFPFFKLRNSAFQHPKAE